MTNPTEPHKSNPIILIDTFNLLNNIFPELLAAYANPYHRAHIASRHLFRAWAFLILQSDLYSLQRFQLRYQEFTILYAKSLNTPEIE